MVDGCRSSFMCKDPTSNTGATLLMPLEGDGCFLNTAQSSDTLIGKVLYMKWMKNIKKNIPELKQK